MKVSVVFPSNFIAAGDLDGRDVTLTVREVMLPSSVKREDGKLIDKPVLYFKETPMGMIVGKTNARAIRLSHGNEMSKWIGKQITIYPTTTSISKKMAEQNGSIILSVNGKMATVACIRVRVKADLAPLRSEENGEEVSL